MQLLLVLGYVWPEPASSAAGWRMLSLLNMFQQAGWQIIFASPAEKSIHRFDLSQWQITEQQISLNDSNFDLLLQQWQPTAVLFDRFMLEEQFGWRVAEHCPQALRLLDSEDLHCLRSARQQAFKQQRPLVDADLHNELALREIASIYRCDLTLTISEFEVQLLQQFYQVPAQQLLYCPFMVADLPLNTQQLLNFDQRQHFCWIGNFRHEPNWQAVLWLKALWPKIRQQLPAAELHLYGAYPPPKATQLHDSKQGFLVKGWADDSLKVLQQARVCLAPLPFGAGLKGKFIDAMRVGTPSVTTTVGAEGMHWQGQWAGLVADENQAIIEAAVALYQDEAIWLLAQQQGAEILSQRFDALVLQPLIWERINQVLHQLIAHRLRNFTGAMLAHHQYRSTKFMAQWIESKNQLAALLPAPPITME